MLLRLLRVLLRVLLRILASMDLLTESLHQVLFGGLIKHRLAVGIRGQAWRGGHFMTRDRGPMSTGKSHHALDSLYVSFVFFTLLFLSLASFALGRLGGCTGLQLTSDEFQVVRDLDATLQKEEFQIASLVFELDLISIFQCFTDCSSRSEHSKDLAPMRTFNAI